MTTPGVFRWAFRFLFLLTFCSILLSGSASASLVALVPQCAPKVNPDTIHDIIRTNSGGVPLQIHLDSAAQLFARSHSEKETVTLAKMSLVESIDSTMRTLSPSFVSWWGVFWGGIKDKREKSWVAEVLPEIQRSG